MAFSSVPNFGDPLMVPGTNLSEEWNTESGKGGVWICEWRIFP